MSALGRIVLQKSKIERRRKPKPKDALNRCITGFDPYTANLDHAHGQDPKRSPATTEPLPLEAHSAPPALRAGRMDRSGRPEGDNDIVEQYKNPSKSFPRAP